MKHTECEDCELSQGDCGYHFKMDGVTNYDIASLSACDKYGNCMFFKSKAEPKGDLISREALKEELKKALDFASATAYIRKLNSLEKTDLVKLALNIIDNAPIVDIKDQIAGAYNEGYMCGNKEAEKARPQGEPVIKCQDCKYRVKEWREDKRMKDKGY